MNTILKEVEEEEIHIDNLTNPKLPKWSTNPKSSNQKRTNIPQTKIKNKIHLNHLVFGDLNKKKIHLIIRRQPKFMIKNIPIITIPIMIDQKGLLLSQEEEVGGEEEEETNPFTNIKQIIDLMIIRSNPLPTIRTNLPHTTITNPPIDHSTPLMRNQSNSSLTLCQLFPVHRQWILGIKHICRGLRSILVSSSLNNHNTLLHNKHSNKTTTMK